MPRLLSVATILLLGLATAGRAQSPSPGSPAAGSPAAGSPAAAAAPSAIVTVAVELFPESLDPALEQAGAPTLIAALYEPLVRFKPETSDFDPATSLAANVKPAGDGLVWEITLKANQTFSDGTPLDAESVAFSLARLLKADHPARPAKAAIPDSAQGVVKNVVVRDKSTVVLELTQPYTPLLGLLASPHAGIISKDSVKDGKLVQTPVSCGAFVVAKRGPGKRVELAPNTKQTRAKPALGRIDVVAAPEGPSRLLWLLSARGDVVEGLTSRDLEDLASYPKYKVAKKDGLGMITLYMNPNVAPFQQPLLREAVIRGIPDALISSFAYDGRASVYRAFYPPWAFGSRGLFKPYAYDPVEAKRLLQMANFDRNGTAFVMWIVPPDGYRKEAMPAFLESLRASMRELAISCLTEIVPRDQFTQRMAGQNPQAVLYWHSANLADPDEVVTQEISKERPLAKLANVAAQDDVQTLIGQSRTRDAQNAREFLYGEIESKMQQGLSVISLASPERAAATSERIAPLKQGLDGFVSLEDLKVGP